jgi:hypothetical protein
MNSDVLFGQAVADERVLTFDIPDEVLERAATAEQSAFTLAFCTSHWDSCGVPPVAR